MDPKKRTMGAAERDEVARAEWRGRVRGRRAEDFVVVDECGSNVNLAPRYARAPRGERACGSAPRNTEANTTPVASMTAGGMGPAMTLEGAADTPAFEAYVERFLAPSLRRGQRPGGTRAMDNLSAHKTERVRELIAARGCEVWYLPAYSPDLSPIEEAFAELKHLLRKAEARTPGTRPAGVAGARDRRGARGDHRPGRGGLPRPLRLRHRRGGGSMIPRTAVDRLVYELYGLTDAEIAVVEGAMH